MHRVAILESVSEKIPWNIPSVSHGDIHFIGENLSQSLGQFFKSKIGHSSCLYTSRIENVNRICLWKQGWENLPNPSSL